MDGAMTFRGDTVEQYVQGVHNATLRDPASGLETTKPQKYTARYRRPLHVQSDVRERLLDRAERPGAAAAPDPGDPHDREHRARKGAGLDDQLLRHAHGRLEYLLGKQLPYVAIGMINFFILTALGAARLRGPDQGQLPDADAVHAALRHGDDRASGMVTSTFTSSQVAAVFVTAILTIVPTIQFSGLLQPVSTLEGSAGVVGSIWPATYYMHSSLGAYTKGLGPGLMLAGHRRSLRSASRFCWPSASLGLKKQEK